MTHPHRIVLRLRRILRDNLLADTSWPDEQRWIDLADFAIEAQAAGVERGEVLVQAVYRQDYREVLGLLYPDPVDFISGSPFTAALTQSGDIDARTPGYEDIDSFEMEGHYIFKKWTPPSTFDYSVPSRIDTPRYQFSYNGRDVGRAGYHAIFASLAQAHKDLHVSLHGDAGRNYDVRLYNAMLPRLGSDGSVRLYDETNLEDEELYSWTFLFNLQIEHLWLAPDAVRVMHDWAMDLLGEDYE